MEEEELHITNPRREIEFQRAHRLGKPKCNGLRPIIARFLRYTDREEVLKKAIDLLKETNFSAFEDMPRQLYQLRKAQLTKLKEAKKKEQKAFFSKRYPDKL